MTRTYERRCWTDDEHARLIALRDSGMTVSDR